MKRTIRFLVVPLLAAVAGSIVLFGPVVETEACACVPPPSLKEIAIYAEEAEAGDFNQNIEATGWVWQAYRERQDHIQTAIWAEKVIAAGEPNALYHMAEELLRRVEDEPDRENKIALLKQALGLLETGYPNRGMMDDTRRKVYATSIRRTRAVLAVAQDGVKAWQDRAEKDEPGAAYNLARYYLDGELDQEKRSYWEARAVRTGDPELVWEEACCWRKTRAELTEGKRLIAVSRASPQAWRALGDPWIEAVLDEDLDGAERQIDRRLKALGAA